MSLYRIGSNIIRPAGGGGLWVPPSAGGPEPPTPENMSGSIIVWDTRAGGAQSYQTCTTIGQILGRWDQGRESNGAFSFIDTIDVDGVATKVRAIQWLADADADTPGDEQEAMVNLESHTNMAPASGFYIQFKTHLGRVSGGLGTGNVGEFILSGSNAHQKPLLIWTSDERYYIPMRTGPTDIKFSIDGTGFNSDFWSDNPYSHPGTHQTITVYIEQATGTLRAWLGPTMVMEQENISATWTGSRTAVLDNIQLTATNRLTANACVQYEWDSVIWYVPP